MDEKKINDSYVYVYIDPRNYEEFYYGKGKGSRKESHLNDPADTNKTRRIKDIKGANLDPIIKVIARGLSESEALLVEKTLLWKLGGQLTNISSGHYKDKFRPHNTMHSSLSGFDYQNGIYYYNVGETKKKDSCRNWDDYIKFGFISAGQEARFKEAMQRFNEGDIFAAYLKGEGFVGIGKIKSRAKPINEVLINGKPLLSHDLVCKNMATNSDSLDDCEYVAIVDWIKVVDRKNAKPVKGKKELFTTPLIRASLDGQPSTIAFLEKEFDLNLKEYLL